MTILERIQELAKLEDGWLGNGEGLAPTPVALANATALATLLEVGKWSLYPTPAGGISVERNDRDEDLEITATGLLE